MSTISEDLAVEVHGSNNAWYKAWIIDVFKTNALCTFENGWKPDQRVPFMRIRLPPDNPSNYPYTLNEDVEVKSNTNPCCWWPATINLVSGDRNTFSIVYKYKSYDYGTSSNYSVDLVGRDRIRPVTQSKFFHPSVFYKYSAEVPDKMRECADIPGVLDEAAFKHFKDDTKASLIRYDKDTNQIVVLTPRIEVYRDVEVCFEYQLSLLEKKVDHLLRKKRYADRLQSPSPTATTEKQYDCTHSYYASSTTASSNKQAQYTEEFKIHPNFMGLAIGSRGKNINEARRIPGIIGLDLNEDLCLFKIVGETREAVEQARNKLEYGELVIDVERDIASRIIGRKGTVIQNIVDKSGCVRVRLDNPLDPDGKDPQITKFMFTGTRISLKYVKIFMNCQIHHAKETIALTEQNLQADSLLRDKIYNKPSPRSTAVPLMTPRAPITPPYPSNEQGGEKNGTPVAPEGASQPVQTLLQTPTLPPTATLPRVEQLTIETQTEPVDHAHVEFAKPAPLPPKHEHHHPKQEDTRIPSPRMPLQKRTSYPSRDVINSRGENAARETYRTSNIRDPTARRSRESPRPSPRDRPPVMPKPGAPKSATPKPLSQKPRVDVKLVNEKIGSALAPNKSKAEDVRSEQQAAIEDLVKAEASNTDKHVPLDHDKENNQNKKSVNNQNVIKVDNNQNVKVDNEKAAGNENISKIDEPKVQTIINEALVCEFSPSE